MDGNFQSLSEIANNDDLSNSITEATIDNFEKLWMENIAQNMETILSSKSIKDLPKHEGMSAIVIAAGPSIKENHHLKMLRESDFEGIIIAVDRMFIPLLKEGIIPDYIVNADGDRENIHRFFDDPIVDEYAEQIKVIFATLAPPNAVNRFKGERYFYNAMIDNPHEKKSITKYIRYLTQKPNINTTGNVGGFGVIFAYYLKCNPIATIGLNLGYPAGTPFENTYSYLNIRKAYPDMTDEEIYTTFYQEYFHPYFKTKSYTEPIFSYYKEGLIDAAKYMVLEGYKIINCTEGGILHEDPIESMWFRDFLSTYGRKHNE
ncbi:6-hydroxymethylpterin diphosphokinase MptE-like protein [Methanolobus psychrotolerans]|uniref:6-hydroxymethylpterin diphosphokinase MptE-like protein n=1 Tax=Methanolobus psychrotolerans TaxID=1874706 RepID=UPI0013ECED04|nr:6-hydroxymethylpterin diphosphokinase MptE-like protein [Methanolobus psychrotolerans]